MREKKLIQLYITNICNSHCKTCSIWKNKKREELSVEDIDKIITAYPDADYVIGGGEAILHSHCEEVLGLLRKKKINYTLLSNCIKLGKLEYLIRKFKVPAVTVSFDGQLHDKIRGSKGNAYFILCFRRWCKKNGVKFKISYTYSRFNEQVFKEDMNMIKCTLKQEEIYFCLAMDMQLLKTAEIGETFVAGNFNQILESDMVLDKDKEHVKGMITGMRRCCTSQNNVHTIYSDGNIVRCQSFKSVDVLGNIKDMSAGEIKGVLDSVENIQCKYDAECNLLCQRRYDG